VDGFGPIASFWVLSVLSIAGALSVMFARTVVHAVLFLVLFFVALAAMFILLSADFVAVAQVLVYAGAIGVLVVFAILLTPQHQNRSMETRFVGPGLLAGAAIAGTVIFVAFQTNWTTVKNGGFDTTAAAIGQALINRWALPFEIASVLLLAAMVGAIVLVKGRGEDIADEEMNIQPRLVRRER
jgi:NADH-quinone oxidoreductase subunit J